MEAVLTYVRYIVIWWLFLNSRSQEKEKNGVWEYRELPCCTHIFIGRLSCVIDLNETNLVLVRPYLRKELHVKYSLL